MKSCDLCVFKRVDDENQFTIGRLIQFSYFSGSKKCREFVDLSKDIDNIGGFCNWYQVFIGDVTEEMVNFKPLHFFTQGYIPFNKLCYKNSR